MPFKILYVIEWVLQWSKTFYETMEIVSTISLAEYMVPIIVTKFYS